MVVLDEPTNYLDRESLGALNTALKDFGGGVVVISHSSGVFTRLYTVACSKGRKCTCHMQAIFVQWLCIWVLAAI